nr:neutral/alkaline non-lysosomal ceramidase N-terminal domain-containing protein [Jiangella mangrovi]
MLLGVDRADITPGRPLPLAGFAFRDGLGPATGTAGPLRLRTLAFSSGDGGGSGGAVGGERAVLVSADLLGWGFDTAERVHGELTRRYGLPARSVLLHATHTHSAPQVSRGFAPAIGAVDDAYVDQVCEAVVDGVGRALAALRPVTVDRFADRAALGHDRRAARSPSTLPRSSVDPAVTVLRFTGPDGVAALLVHFACHPVVHRDNVVTPDFAGAAMDLVERRYPGTVAVYAQGCCGDIDPLPSFATVDAAAGELALAVARALSGTRIDVGPAALATERTTVELPLQDGADPPSAPVVVSSLRLAADLQLLGVSGEPVGAYGRRVAVLSGGTTLPLGYTNGMTGYLVTARQLAQGGYEADEAPYWFGLPGRFAPQAEGVLHRALAAALRPR